MASLCSKVVVSIVGSGAARPGDCQSVFIGDTVA